MSDHLIPEARFKPGDRVKHGPRVGTIIARTADDGFLDWCHSEQHDEVPMATWDIDFDGVGLRRGMCEDGMLKIEGT
jgi:hypothetical protein